MLTVEIVEARVRRIRKVKSDAEKAHHKEDLLYRDVLRSIVQGHPTPALLAEAALKTKEIDFSRWYS